LIAGRQDDPSFERIVNTPTRGIGNRTLEQVREYARINQTSMWDGARALIHQRELSSRALSSLAAFVSLIEGMSEAVDGLTLAEAVEVMLERSGLVAHFAKEKGEKGQARIENLEELITAARNHEHEDEDGMDPLSAFLSHAALEAGERQGQEWEECVQLMSLHSAKGLEFPLVFLTGMEEGLFPHQRSLQESGRLEEERRLCYVGMTRAMRILYISYAEVRRLHGRDNYGAPSRFLGEVPTDMLSEVRAGLPRAGGWPKPVSAGQPTGSMQLGGRVRHNSFGDGVVLGVEGHGEHTRVQVNFESVGNKWLVLAYANLQNL
jgi:DNA helicase-2/ATP-dependent DNA helicase PcrA